MELKDFNLIDKPEDIRNYVKQLLEKPEWKTVIPDYDRNYPPPILEFKHLLEHPTEQDILKLLYEIDKVRDKKIMEIVISSRKQREALIDFYKNANGDHWANNTNWCAPGKDISTWYGVKTRVALIVYVANFKMVFRTVTELNLSHNDMYPNNAQEDNCIISPRIGDLEDLEVLNLSRNFIYGIIPDEIYTLKKLKGLYLHFNQITEIISGKIGNLENLEYLQLDHNRLTGCIPPAIGKLKMLKTLCLHVNDLDNGLRRLLLSHLKTDGKLKTIKPVMCGTPLPASIGKIGGLTKFCAYGNQLCGTIPDSIARNEHYAKEKNAATGTYKEIGDWHLIDQQDGVKLKIDFKPTLGRPRPIKQKK